MIALNHFWLQHQVGLVEITLQGRPILLSCVVHFLLLHVLVEGRGLFFQIALYFDLQFLNLASYENALALTAGFRFADKHNGRVEV